MVKFIRTYEQRLEALSRISDGAGAGATAEAIRTYNDRYRATLASLGLALTTVPHNFGPYVQAPWPHSNSINPWPIPSWIVGEEDL